mgnify:CR=1 FL=1
MRRVRKLLCLAIACAGAALGTGMAPGYAEDAKLSTLLHGVLHRQAAIGTVEGTALVRRRYSAAYNEDWARRQNERWDELAQKRTGTDGGPQAAVAGGGTGAPFSADSFGAEEVTWIDFAYDREDRQWRLQMVSLTNNGHPDVECGLSAANAPIAGYPPWAFFFALTCDGHVQRTYDRGLQRAMVRALDRYAPRMMHVDVIENYVVCGLAPWEISGLEDETYKAALVRVTDGGSMGTCYEIRLSADIGGYRNLSLLTVAPELGFALVRRVDTKLPKSTTDDNASSEGRSWARIVACSRFVEVAEGVWCAKSMRTDSFEGDLSSPEAAWWHSRTYEMELTANGSVRDAAACQFPVGVAVTDLTGHEPDRNWPPPYDPSAPPVDGPTGESFAAIRELLRTATE